MKLHTLHRQFAVTDTHDLVDLTIVLGRDVLGDAETEGTPGSTTPGSPQGGS